METAKLKRFAQYARSTLRELLDAMAEFATLNADGI
jgi:hypothetical protein